MAIPVSFRWDEGFVRRVDEARGLVPRSAFVRAAVEEALGRDESSRRLVEMMKARERPNTMAEAGAAVKKVFSEPLPDAPSPLNELLELEPGEEPYEPDPNAGCFEHREAGRVESRGSWWCAEPGCTRGVA